MDPMIPKQFREKFTQSTDLTRSPQVNELIKICREIKEGRGDTDILKAQIDVLYDVHEAMNLAYDSLAPTQPKTPLFIEKGAKMKAAFDELKEGLDEVSLYLEDEDAEHIDMGLDTVKKAMDDILDTSDALKKEEDAVEVLSHSPPVNELLRIGKGVLKGEFKPIYFFRRYQVVEDMYAKTSRDIEKLSKLPPDTKAMEEQLPVIQKALELFRDGLDDLQECFVYLDKKSEEMEDPESKELTEILGEEEDPDFDFKARAEEALDKIQQGSLQIYEANVAIKEGIDKAVEEDAKKKEWQSKIPGYAAGPVGGGLDIKVGETPPPAGQEQLMIPPNFKKVYDAAWAVAKKEISKEEFGKTLEWLASTVNKNISDLPKLVKPKGLTEQEEQLFDQTKTGLTDAMNNTMRGLEEMRRYITDEDTSHLENGLDLVMRSGDILYKIQLAGEDAAKKIQQAKAEAKKKK